MKPKNGLIQRVVLPTVRLRKLRMRFGRNKDTDTDNVSNIILDDGGNLLLDDGGLLLIN